MKKLSRLSKIFLLLFLLPLAAHSRSDVSVINWKENINLTNSGKSSEILIEGKVNNLGQNEAVTSFAIGLDERRNVKITKVVCDNQLANYSFNNNVLTVKFSQPKTNGKTFSLYFAYDEKYDKIHKSLRQEAIDIPPFAAGADAKVTINFPWSFESATLNPNITKAVNSFIYSNIVPQDGVHEIIKLTASQSTWDVAVKVKISANQNLKNISVTLPTYFQNGGQKVENFITSSSVNPTQQITAGNNKIFKFNSAQKEITIENKARISTGRANRSIIMREPDDYLKVSPEETALLTPILEKIKQDPKYKNFPLYAKIGKFVHDFIKYDIRYTGRLPEIKEILQKPVGVCTEYSKLYNSLARLAKIPAIMIDGSACGEYDECQGHAWNIIYYNNQWINVDPTWDLMSGVVSSSHIYFNDYKKGEVEVQYSDENGEVSSKIDFEMKNPLSN